MDNKERLSLCVHGLILNIRDTFSLPTHKTLSKTFYYSLALLACSVLSQLLGFYTFISWQGCLACNVLILVLLIIERRENDALSQMYRTARLSAEKALQRAKTAGANISSKRGSNGGNWRTGSHGKRKQSGSK